MEHPSSIVVTGVSSGIGLGLLEVLTAHGYHVFGSLRRRKDAEKLSLRFKSSFTPLIFDVVDEQAVRRSAEEA